MTPNRGMGPPWGAFCQITLTSCSIPNGMAILRRGPYNGDVECKGYETWSWGRWKCRTGKCRTWKWRTKSQGMKMQDLLGMRRAFVVRYKWAQSRHEQTWKAAISSRDCRFKTTAQMTTLQTTRRLRLTTPRLRPPGPLCPSPHLQNLTVVVKCACFNRAMVWLWCHAGMLVSVPNAQTLSQSRIADARYAARPFVWCCVCFRKLTLRRQRLHQTL